MFEKKYDDRDIESILKYSKKLVGKTIGEVSQEILVQFSGNKGAIGQFIEKNYFGIENNSLQEPDFIHVGVELKVTPLKRLKNGDLKAKERLVLTIINYEDDHGVDFYASHLYNKINHILIVTYLFEKEKNSSDFLITDSIEYKIPKEDLPTILEDYQRILELIAAGKAHEISESHTTYLGACTKGANGESMRIQPNSDELAKQRAWSFKASYMNYYYDKFKANRSGVSITEGTDRTLIQIIDDKLTKYTNVYEAELLDKFNLSRTTSKNKYQRIASGMFGIKGTRLEDIAEFQKSNIKLKAIRIQKNNTVKEDMNFETIKYEEIVKEKVFEQSNLYQIFAATAYLILFFKEDENGDYYFEKYIRWSLSFDELLEVEKYWNKLKKGLSETILIQPIQQEKKVIYKYLTLPTSSITNIFHCRTKGIGKRKSGTYGKIPENTAVKVLERIYTKKANKDELLPYDNLPNSGEIHSMCTFVHKRKIIELYNKK